MSAYILKGDPKELDKVIRENRIRVSRGVISITPAEPDTALDEDSVKTLIEGHRVLGEERQRLIAGHNRLAELTGMVVSLAVEGGQTIPDDLSASLAEFGIIVPKIEETAENTAEISENLPESVPNLGESENIENENPDAMDHKNVEVDDMIEADLDADDKTPVINDTKDVPAADSKETETAKKTTRRSKKSE